MTQVAAPVRRAAQSTTMDRLARFGLFARGVIYLVIGWLGLQIALGDHPHEANQRGALAEVARNDLGWALLWILGFGFGAYALWRLSQAVSGTSDADSGTGQRLAYAARGLVYAGLCVSTFSFIAGTSRTDQASQQATLTARLMRHDLGRWLVGAVGVGIVCIGIYMIVAGVTRRFEKHLRMDEMSHRTRVLVSRVGMIGTVARGVVFAGAGVLVIAAAVTFDPHKSKGLDGALRTLNGHSYGPWLVGALAAGLIAFGLFGLAAARWAKT